MKTTISSKPQPSPTKASTQPGRQAKALLAFLASKPGATLAPMPAPRGANTGVQLCKLMGKMFAIASLHGEAFVIVKCDPNLIHMLKQQYQGVGHRSHLDKRFWIAVTLDADVPLPEIKQLIDHSYGLISASLTRKQQAELAALTV